MSKDGYEIYEPEICDGWFAVVNNRSLLVAFLTWLIGQIELRLGEQFRNLRLELISVNYHGSYPAIGIGLAEDVPEDISVIMDAAVKEILLKSPVYDFVAYIFSADTDWSKVTNELLRD